MKANTIIMKRNTHRLCPKGALFRLDVLDLLASRAGSEFSASSPLTVVKQCSRLLCSMFKLVSLVVFIVFFMPGQIEAQRSINELFLLLPDSECGGYSKEERQLMIDEAVLLQPAPGRSLKPDPQKPWLNLMADNLLILNRPSYGELTFKSFDGDGFQLIAVCRNRQNPSPMDRVCLMGLCLIRHDINGSNRADLIDYLPKISILDFVRADTIKDPQALKEIAARARSYGQCLSCKASVHDRLAIDIFSSTSINAAACANFIPSFGFLPLSWNGRMFTKPYDRADTPPGQ